MKIRIGIIQLKRVYNKGNNKVKGRYKNWGKESV